MPRVLTILRYLFAGAMVWAAAALASEPLIPPEIVDMKIIGRMGAYTNSITSELLINGNYLYCSTIWGGGLKTLDVSDPSNMVLTSEWTDGGGGSGQAYGLAIKGTVLYLANWAPNNGLRIFNIADPAHPSLIRTRSTTVHAWKLCVEGNLLFISVSNGYDVAGIDIFDITTPSNPAFLTFLSSPHRLVGRPAAFGNYLYMTGNNWLRVYSISNPASPGLVRQLSFNARTGTGTLKIKDGYLYMSADDDTYPDPDWLDGGVYVFSLSNPSDPQQVGYYDQPVFKDLHLQGRYCIIPHGSGPVLALDLLNTPTISFLWQASMAWPNTGPGGYPECASGAGEYVFIGVVDSNGCTQCGARVYSVHIQVPKPPIIKEVAPDPESLFAGQPYSKQLKLLQGTPTPTWSVVQAPADTEVDGDGLVSGWVPAASDIGATLTITIRATNEDGFDDESWQVRVKSIADFDHDDDVDLEDFGHLQACFSKLNEAPPPGCDDANLDGDIDIDQDDFAVFLPCMRGANNPPGC